MIPSKILPYVFGSVKTPVRVLKVNSTEASLTWEDSKPEHVHRYRTPFAPEKKIFLDLEGTLASSPTSSIPSALNKMMSPPPGWGMSLCSGRDRRGTTQIRWLWRQKKRGSFKRTFRKLDVCFHFGGPPNSPKQNFSSPYDPLWFSASTKNQNVQFFWGVANMGTHTFLGLGWVTLITSMVWSDLVGG